MNPLQAHLSDRTNVESPGHSQSSPDHSHPGLSGGNPTSSAGIDLTRPIISSSSALEANKEQVDDGDLESEASSSSDPESQRSTSASDPFQSSTKGVVSVSGTEPLIGSSNIVAERVSTHGHIRPFEAISEVVALSHEIHNTIGQVHPDGAIKKWLAKRHEWDIKYGKELEKWREIKKEDRRMGEKWGFLTRDLQGERVPLCSIVGWWDLERAREVGKSVDGVMKKGSGAMNMWAKISQQVGLALYSRCETR
jgi:hypothetical protein